MKPNSQTGLYIQVKQSILYSLAGPAAVGRQRRWRSPGYDHVDLENCRRDLQHTDAVSLPRLRPSGAWHGEGTGQRGQQEAAAIHPGMVG